MNNIQRILDECRRTAECVKSSLGVAESEALAQDRREVLLDCGRLRRRALALAQDIEAVCSRISDSGNLSPLRAPQGDQNQKNETQISACPGARVGSCARTAAKAPLPPNQLTAAVES